MVKRINLRNLDQSQKELVDEKILKVFRHLDFRTNVYFEKYGKGGFRGRVEAYSKWGDTSIEMERKDLIELCHHLKKKVQSKVFKNKLRSIELKNSFSQCLPDYHFVQEDELYSPRVTHLSLKKIEKRPLNALIIDDDIDSLLPVEKILRKLGCRTSFAIDELDAVTKIKEGKADLIVLDWLLGKSTGNDIIEACTTDIQLMSNLHNKFRELQPKVVTYSGLKFKDIKFSQSMNQYFSHIDHWDKPINFNEMEVRTSNVLGLVEA